MMRYDRVEGRVRRWALDSQCDLQLPPLWLPPCPREVAFHPQAGGRACFSGQSSVGGAFTAVGIGPSDRLDATTRRNAAAEDLGRACPSPRCWRTICPRGCFVFGALKTTGPSATRCADWSDHLLRAQPSGQHVNCARWHDRHAHFSQSCPPVCSCRCRGLRGHMVAIRISLHQLQHILIPDAARRGGQRKNKARSVMWCGRPLSAHSPRLRCQAGDLRELEEFGR